MADTYFGDLYKNVEDGVTSVNIPAGSYDAVVTEARAREESSLIFLTLQVLNGPQAGKQTEVNLYLPRPGDKPFATTMFLRKIAGFSGFPDVKAAFHSADTAPDRASGLDFIANALIGKQIAVDVQLRTEGQYAGTNELAASKSIASTPVATAQPQPQPQPQPETQEQPAVQGVPF